MTPIEILHNMKAFFEQGPEFWIKGAETIGDAHCLTGALKDHLITCFSQPLFKNDPDDPHLRAIKYLAAAIPPAKNCPCVCVSIAAYNDNVSVSYEDILSLLDRAISAAEADQMEAARYSRYSVSITPATCNKTPPTLAPEEVLEEEAVLV